MDSPTDTAFSTVGIRRERKLHLASAPTFPWPLKQQQKPGQKGALRETFFPTLSSRMPNYLIYMDVHKKTMPFDAGYVATVLAHAGPPVQG